MIPIALTRQTRKCLNPGPRAAAHSNKSRHWHGALRALLFGAILAAHVSAESAVVQQVEARFTPSSGAEVIDSDQIFAVTSGDIDQDVLAQINLPGRYSVTAAAGRFGQVGLQVGNLSAGTGSTLTARVLVGSDEFVNIFSVPARVRTQFIVDGGRLLDAFSTNTSTTFELQVGAANQGVTDPLSELLLPGFAETTAALGDLLAGGGSYTATLSTDAGGNRSFASSFVGNLDLGATFDGIRQAEIPLSLQTLELGILQPNERLLIGYLASITIVQNGAAEGISGTFSDPFTLAGEPNPIVTLGGVVLTPIPEPQMATMLIAGLFAIFGIGYRRIGAALVPRPRLHLMRFHGVWRVGTACQTTYEPRSCLALEKPSAHAPPRCPARPVALFQAD